MENTVNNEVPKLKLLGRIIKEVLLPYWPVLLASIGLMVIVAATNAGQAFLIQPAVDETLFSEGADNSMLYQIPLLIIIVSLAKAIATYYQQLISTTLNIRMINDLRLRLYTKFLGSDMKFFNEVSSSRMLSNVYNDIGGMISGVSVLMTGLFRNLLSVIFLFMVMLYQNPMLTLMAFVGFPLAIYPIYLVFKKVHKYMKRNQVYLENFTVLLDDALRGVRVVKSYNAEEYEISRMRRSLNDIYNNYWRVSRASNIPGPLNEFLIGVGTAAVLFYGGSLVVGGDATPGSFFSFFAAMMMAYKPLKSVGSLNIQLQTSLVCAERIFALLDRQNEITDKPDATAFGRVSGDIGFSGVSFGYNESRAALDNIDFKLKAGGRYAFVGHSGSGKSTIMNLLLRFYDPTEGKVTVDGTDIRDVTIASLREQMSFVGQEVQLFDDTIRENIRYSRKDATDAEIEAAAKLAEAHDFIIAAENGYDTRIGQNGGKLSGGQRQRLSIARAILRNSPILLLDEATSALDPASEKLVQQALDKLMEGRTTMVIAHRLATVMNADTIFVLNKGKITEHGSHKELLEKNGEYAVLYSKQFQE